MGHITKPTFAPDVPPIPFAAANINDVLTVISASQLAFMPAAGGGGGLAGRYATAPAAGTYNNYDPGSGWPNSDTGARLIITPTGSIELTGLVAGKDGELVLIWNNAAVGSGFNMQFDNLNGGSLAANQFTISGASFILIPQGRTLAVYDGTLALWSIG